MKNKLMLFGLVSLLLVGCSLELKDPVPNSGQEAVTPVQDLSITYSYLTDPTVQNEVRTLLNEHGISPENMNTYFQSLNHFNDVMSDMGGVYTGFKTLNLSELVIDNSYISDTWMNNITFPDLNCRTTVFTLIKDLVSVSNLKDLEDYENYLMFDLDMIQNNPNFQLTETDSLKFKNLYTAIPAQVTTDISVHIADVLKTWGERGMEFQMNENLSVINVFMHDEYGNALYIGHSGLLIQSEDCLYFLEKLAPFQPYMVSKFDSRDDLKNYLHLKYDMYSNGENAKPFFMENDAWMGN